MQITNMTKERNTTESKQLKKTYQGNLRYEDFEIYEPIFLSETFFKEGITFLK